MTYSAFPVDAHIQGVCVASRAVHHFRGQHSYQLRPLGDARERTRVALVVVRHPPEVAAGIGSVVIGGALLGAEVWEAGRTWLKR